MDGIIDAFIKESSNQNCEPRQAQVAASQLKNLSNFNRMSSAKIYFEIGSTIPNSLGIMIKTLLEDRITFLQT